MKKDWKEYQDIIHLPNHRSKTRPQMSLHDRAAQFSPFAALTGHEDAIEETARLTEQKVELAEETKARLNARLLLIEQHLQKQPEVSITYFLPDKQKSGGAYVTKKGIVKRIDHFARAVIMADELTIPTEDISSIEGKLFHEFEQ